MRRRGADVLSALLAMVALLTLAGPALAATPQTSLGDIEDEVMCPVCGTLLELTYAPQAQRERAFISRLVAAGASKDQIKDALVAEYGEVVLAKPRGSGFQLSAYLVPILVFVVVAVALAVGVARWRRSGGDDGDGPAAPRDEDADRLDADIARYDL